VTLHCVVPGNRKLRLLTGSNWEFAILVLGMNTFYPTSSKTFPYARPNLIPTHGIQFIETEESYTSKARFLDSDTLPKYGEKPERWKESGKVIQCGLYRSADGTKINADSNGAANILRKVVVTLGLSLEGISSGALTTSLRVRILAVQESPSL
jgi:hypothetical protein